MVRNSTGEKRSSAASVKYGERTFREIALAAERDCLVILPTGCLEQQGEHLPVDFDTWLAEEVALAGTERARDEHGIESLVMPPVPYGPTPEHRGFGAGFVDLPQALHESLIEAVLESLVSQGFRRVLVWRGCGQHKLEGAIEGFLQRRHDRLWVEMAPDIFSSIWKTHGIPGLAAGHADAFATSIALYRRPESVRMGEIRRPLFSIPNWDDPSLDLSRHTDSGSIGDPSRASAELGEVLWEAVIGMVSDLIVDFDARTSQPSRE